MVWECPLHLPGDCKTFLLLPGFLTPGFATAGIALDLLIIVTFRKEELIFA